MRLLSSRQQFIADHSSTNYLFFAAKPLSKETRAYINTLSSHVDVGSRKAELQYHGDYADLGEARRKKFLEHYDVEVRESYDWWTLSVMLDAATAGEPVSNGTFWWWGIAGTWFWIDPVEDLAFIGMIQHQTPSFRTVSELHGVSRQWVYQAVMN